jgi:hypothetical protein
MFVFRPDDAVLELEGGTHACLVAADCSVELVMWAWDPQARPDGVDVVLVGENEGDYLVEQTVGGDKARLMAVRERGDVGAEVEQSETSASGALPVPTDASATLVYSHELDPDGLVAGEQFVIEAKFVTAVSARARVSSMMFVAADPAATEKQDVPGITPQEIGEHNGINCTAGQSPCTTRKVAVFRADDDVPGPLYVQIVVKSAVPGGGSADVSVQRGAGWLRSLRYAASLDR